MFRTGRTTWGIPGTGCFQCRRASAWSVFAAAALLAILCLTATSVGQQGPAGTYRDGVSAGLPGLNCGQRAMEIKTVYNRIKRLGSASGADPALELFRLRKRWANLKVECPSIGALEPDKPDLPPAKDLKTDEWKEMMGEEADRLEADAKNEERLATQDAALFGEYAKKVPMAVWPKTYHEIKAAEDKDQAAQIRKLIADPPSADYGGVTEVKPVAEPTAADDTTELGKLSAAASKAARMSSRYVQAYTTSFERYQGAKEAGDAEKMRLQTVAMVNFALAAQQESRTAALKWHALEQTLEPIRMEAEAARDKSGLTLKAVMADMQIRLKANGFSPERRQALAARGMTEKDIDAYRQRLLDTSPKDVEEASAANKIRGQSAESIRAALVKDKSTAFWPQPTHVLALETLEYDARRLYRRVMQTRFELILRPASRKGTTWWALPAGAPPHLDRDRAFTTQVSGPLLAGKYDIWLATDDKNPNQARPLARRIARGIPVVQGKTARQPVAIKAEADEQHRPALDSRSGGIKLTLGEGFAKPFSWFVLAHDADSTRVFAEATGGSLDALPIPAGKYDLYWIATEAQRQKPLLLARGVAVAEKEVTALTLNAGVRLEVARWVSARDPKQGWWGVVPAGHPAEERVHWSQSEDRLLLPPGKYDVIWAHSSDARPVRLATAVEVKEHAVTAVAADAGIRLKWTSSTPLPDGQWAAAPAGDDREEQLHRAPVGSDCLVLPAGIYDLFIRSRPDRPWGKIGENVVVKEHTLVEREVQLAKPVQPE